MNDRSNSVNWWFRMNRRLASFAPIAWLFSVMAHHVDRLVLRMSHGRTTFATLLTGVPVITLTAVGAKTGQRRSLPLLGAPDGDNIILIASNWGGTKHPAWYHNVKANPQVEVTYQNQTKAYIAHEVAGTERERCWQKAVAIYPGYDAYKSRTNGREIPVILLTPISS